MAKPNGSDGKPLKPAGRIEQGVNADVLYPELKFKGAEALPGVVVGGGDKLPVKTGKRKARTLKLDPSQRVLRRGDVELTFLLIRRVFALDTPSLMVLWDAASGAPDADVSLSSTCEPWDVKEAMRVRCSVMKQIVMWALDQKRSPFGPFQRGKGVYDDAE